MGKPIHTREKTLGQTNMGKPSLKFSRLFRGSWSQWSDMIMWIRLLSIWQQLGYHTAKHTKRKKDRKIKDLNACSGETEKLQSRLTHSMHIQHILPLFVQWVT